MADTTATPKTKVKTKTERPRLHKVILINDDYTPREFVVTVLKAEFRMTEDQAHKVMITAHRRGVCVVAVFTKDVAETKATRATDAGRAKGYPLLFTTEPEEWPVSVARMERSVIREWQSFRHRRNCSDRDFSSPPRSASQRSSARRHSVAARQIGQSDGERSRAGACPD